MASVDLKDAYYTVPIHKDYHKYLAIEWMIKLMSMHVCQMG